MARNFVYYDAFAKGETGLHGDYLDGYRLFRGILIYTGTWHGYNIQRNIDGSIGPRPGLFPYTLTGLPNGKTAGLSRSAFTAKTGIIVVGTGVYLFDTTNTASQAVVSAGTLGSAPTSPVAIVYSGNFAYLTNPGDKTYQIDLSAATTTAIPNTPGGSCISFYNQHLVIGNCTGGTGGGASNGNRLIFSDNYTPGNAAPNQYPFQAAPTFADIGDAWQITGLFNQRSHLAISKQNAWFVYQGEPAINAVVRQVNTNAGPLLQQNAFLLRDGLIVFVPLNTDMPVTFNGSAIQEMRHLRFANGVYVTAGAIPASFGAIELNQPQDFLLLAGHDNTGGADKGVLYHNGAWSYHNFGVNTSGNLTKNAGVVIMADDGAVGAPPNVYAWPTDLDRPVKVGDSFGAIADGSAAASGSVANSNYVEFPEWESRDGSEVVVRAVHVSFKKWNTGTTQTNHLECRVISTRQYNKPGTVQGPAGFATAQGQPSLWQPWDEAPSLTTTDGQYQHHVFKIGDQSTGNGFKLAFQNLRGVAIQKIQVILDIMPTRS